MNRETREHDGYWKLVEKHYVHILYLYEQFAKKHPVMLYDVQEQRIYACPYQEFADELSQKSQRSLATQYQAALTVDQMVVFVRDNVKQQLVSFLVPLRTATKSKRGVKRPKT